jgi:putative ABC transport system permease protein
MNALFGVSMTLIMWVLLVVLGVALASVGLIAVRNTVMFKLGIRNIPRRRSQTVLIVLGLMLSTLIISAAFTTGDTVNRSVTNEVYSVLGSLDETIFAKGVGPENIDEEDENTVDRDVSFSAQDGAKVVDALRSEPSIDAVVPVLPTCPSA